MLAFFPARRGDCVCWINCFKTSILSATFRFDAAVNEPSKVGYVGIVQCQWQAVSIGNGPKSSLIGQVTRPQGRMRSYIRSHGKIVREGWLRKITKDYEIRDTAANEPLKVWVTDR